MNYKSLLYEIQQGENGSYMPDAIEINVPSNLRLYKIDLNSRTIEAPQYLSVLEEHHAETVYFLVNRYYDNMDLSQTVCIISFITPDNKGYVYVVPYCDITTFYGKMILPWNISGAATAQEGTVQYAVSFYLMENAPTAAGNLDTFDWDSLRFSYRLSTQIATGTVLHGLSLDQVASDEEFGFNKNLSQLYTLLDGLNTALANSVTYWTDV